MTKTMKKLFLTLILAMTVFTCFAEIKEFTTIINGRKCKIEMIVSEKGNNCWSIVYAAQQANHWCEEYNLTMQEALVINHDQLADIIQSCFVDFQNAHCIAVVFDDGEVDYAFRIDEQCDFCENDKFYVVKCQEVEE